MRKGQTSLFIIIGILILIVVGVTVFVFTQSQETPDEVPFSLDTQPIEFMIESCMQKTGREGLQLLAKQGNRIDVPDPLKFGATSWWIVEYANVMPTLNASADEFQEWYEEELPSCLTYDAFPGFAFEEGEPDVQIHYGGETVLFDLHFPLNVSKDGKTVQLEKFETELNIRYRRLFERAKDVNTVHFAPSFDYRKPFALVDAKNVTMTYEVVTPDKLVFTLVDDITVDEEPLLFTFATDLGRSNLKRSVKVNDETLNFAIPQAIYSPDRLAALTIFPGSKVNVDEIQVYQTYPEEIYRDVVNKVAYVAKGSDITLLGQETDTFIWNIDYPIYSFEPNGTKFDPPQLLSIFWDEDKNPNDGPMGMMYRGVSSDYQWRPLPTYVDYNNSYMHTYIPSFSDFTPVDCGNLQCKESLVTSNSEPPSGFMCFLSGLMEIIKWVAIALIIIGIGAAILASAKIIAVVGAEGVVAKTFTSALGAIFKTTGLGFISQGFFQLAVVGLIGTIVGGMFMPLDYDAGETFTTFTPSCNQIVELTCSAGGDLRGGFGQLGEHRVEQGGTLPISVDGGIPQRLTAVAEKCKKSTFSCKKCSITCGVGFK